MRLTFPSFAGPLGERRRWQRHPHSPARSDVLPHSVNSVHPVEKGSSGSAIWVVAGQFELTLTNRATTCVHSRGNGLDIHDTLPMVFVVVPNATSFRRSAIWCLCLAMLLTFPAFSASANQVVAWGDPTNVPVEANQAVAISAGWGYSLAIAPDGSLIDWGNDPGTPPTGLNNLVAVAASHGHSLALTADGTVIVWGSPDLSWAWGGTPDGLTNIVAISANGDVDGEQSLALKNDGTVVAWGNVSSVPDSLSNVVAIAAGGWHELALKNDGTVVAWGDDTYGQTDLPDDLTNVIAIAAGDFHSLALKSDGTVSAWGWDGEGELDMPDGLTNVIAISAGTYDSLALKSDGTVVA